MSLEWVVFVVQRQKFTAIGLDKPKLFWKQALIGVVENGCLKIWAKSSKNTIKVLFENKIVLILSCMYVYIYIYA